MVCPALARVKQEAAVETMLDSKRMHMLLDVVRMITLEKNPDDLLWLITIHGAGALQTERGSIFILDEARSEIWSKVALGESGIIRFPRGRGIAGEVIEKGQTIRIPDAYADPRFNPKIDHDTGFKTRNILAIPMINAAGKAIGCFQLINKLNGDFSELDESFGEAFAAQAAVAIESALLHQQKDAAIKNLEQAQQELQSNIKLLRILYEIEQDCHAITELKEFLFAACKKALQVTDGCGVALLLETAPNVWDLFGTFGKEDNVQITKRIEDTASVEHYLNVLPPPHPLDCSKTNERNYLARWLAVDNVKSMIFTRPHINIATGHGEQIVRRIALEIFSSRSDAFSTTDMRFIENIGAKIGSMVEKKMLIEQQTESNRLAMIGQLTSSIIHDFKNPLTVMQCFAEIIEGGTEADGAKLQHFGSVIRAQVSRCRKMTEELLRFARGEKSFTFEEVQLPIFFKEIELILALETARQKISLEIKVNCESQVWMDREKMMRLIFNLTNNAMEVLKEGDKITIDCDQTADGMIRIRVADNGPGVPEAIRKTLFNPFVTAGKKGGTGLGLHIAKDIATGHMGDIGLDETYREGARFVLTLHPDPRPQEEEK